jgi:hypothetical protein
MSTSRRSSPRSTATTTRKSLADTTVLPNFTNNLATEYKGRGVDLTYKTYAGVDHAGAVLNAKVARDAERWVKQRL